MASASEARNRQTASLKKPNLSEFPLSRHPAPNADPLRRPNLVRGIALSCALMTLWGLVYPFNFHVNPDAVWLDTTMLGKINSLVNLLLFVPMGFLGGWAGQATRQQQKRAVILKVALLGAALSFLGETAQFWLPRRDSSLMDLLTNMAGAAVGAHVGWGLGPRLTRWWNGFANWASGHPATQRALVVLFAIAVLRLAPFDVSPETFYLRMALQDTYQAGGPFASYRAWLWNDTPTYDQKDDAKVELLRSGASFCLFAFASMSIVAAARERSLSRGERSVPYGSIALVGCALVITTELLQGLVRSRLMDATDLVAGIGGVAGGLILGLFAGPPGPQSASRGIDERVSQTLLGLSLSLAALVAYISLLPLRPRLIPISIAIERFLVDIQDFDPSRVNRTDWPLNGLAFLLMAFMWCAAVVGPNRNRVSAAMWSAIIWVALLTGGLALEFLQVFLPSRSTSPHDPMSQAVGCGFGIALWWLAGPRMIRPIIGAVTRHGTETLRSLLQLYLAAYLFYSIMPMDIVIGLGEIKAKLRWGGIRPLPFSTLANIRFHTGWVSFRDIVLAVPIGVLVGRSRFGTGRFIRPLIAGGTLFVAVEMVQTFLRSRVASTDDVLLGLLGVALGIAISHRGLRRLAGWPQRKHALAAFLYAAVLAMLYTLPFDFYWHLLNRESVMDYLFTVPFTALQFRPPFPALDDMLFTMLIATPLGVFLGIWLSPWNRSWLDGIWGQMAVALIAAPWLALIGLMQLAIPLRTSDPTEVCVGTAGVVLGAALAKRVTCAPSNQPNQEPTNT